MTTIKVLRIKYTDMDGGVERTLPDIDPGQQDQLYCAYRTIKHLVGRGEISPENGRDLTSILIDVYRLDLAAHETEATSIGDILETL